MLEKFGQIQVSPNYEPVNWRVALVHKGTQRESLGEKEMVLQVEHERAQLHAM